MLNYLANDYFNYSRYTIGIHKLFLLNQVLKQISKFSVKYSKVSRF